ncbi:MAG: ATP-binding protein [Micropepsaceae bacterium]
MTTEHASDRNLTLPEDAPRAERVEFDLAERAARFGYWRLRLADGHLTWSPGMYRLLGVDPSLKPCNKWLLSQIVDQDVAHLTDTINHAIKARSSFYYRTRVKDPNAATQIADTHGEMEIGPDGRVVSVIGVCTDVTSQVKAEAERERAQHIYRTVAEEASDIIILHEEQGIVFASRALDSVMGRTPEEIQDGNYLDLVHPDDIGEALKLRGRPPPGVVWSGTWRGLHKDGRWIWMENRTRAVYDEEGRFCREITVVRDITDRKEHELKLLAAHERAEAASRAKSLFLANMSHELRTPLNAIIGFSDMMCAQVFGALGNERYIEYADDIRNSGRHLLELITSVLDIAKIEAGKLELHFEAVDLSFVIDECVHLLRVGAAEAGIELIADADPDTGGFLADRRAVKQILLNLLSNAMKFTPSGGHVTIATRAAGERIELSVRDDGIGIPADQLPRLGKPFEQVCTDPLLAKGGSGLGLALVKAIAEKHGGRMSITSAEGAGTTVTIDFLRDPRKHEAAA